MIEEKTLSVVLDDAAHFYARCLEANQGKKAREYLAERKTSEEQIKTFCIGYCPDSWTDTLNYLKGKGFSEEAIIEAGLAKKKEETGHVFNLYKGRLMLPIRDAQGRVIGFGGRTLAGEEPKYINSPETSLFKKSKLLYGLHEALPLLEKNKQLVVAEGYFDVIALQTAGIPAVAPLGTSLTTEQAILALKYSPDITVMLDSDEPGKKAALKAFETFAVQGANPMLVLSDEKDPADLLKSEGVEALKRLAERKMHITSFYRSAFVKKGEEKTLEARLEASKKFVPMLRRIKDEAWKLPYEEHLEAIFGFRWKL